MVHNTRQPEAQPKNKDVKKHEGERVTGAIPLSASRRQNKQMCSQNASSTQTSVASPPLLYNGSNGVSRWVPVSKMPKITILITEWKVGLV